MNKAESKLVLELRAENAKFQKDIDEANRKLEKFGQTADRQTQNVANGMKEMDVAARKANHAIGMSSNQMNQFGVQMQDVIVQAQAGTSWFTILAQQGSQLAAAFGPSGALIGGVVALSAALGGILWRSFDAASAKAEEMRLELDKLYESTERAKMNTLRDQIDAQERSLKNLREQAKAAGADMQRFGAAVQNPILRGTNMKGYMAALEQYSDIDEQIKRGEATLAKLIGERDADKIEAQKETYKQLDEAIEFGLKNIERMNEESWENQLRADKEAQKQRLQAIEQAERDRTKLMQSVEQIRNSGMTDTARENELYANNLAILDEYRNKGLGTHQQYNALVESETKRHNATIYQINDKAYQEQARAEKEASDLLADMVQDALKAHEDYVKERERILQQYDPATQEMARHKAMIDAIKSANQERVMGDMEANAKLEEEATRHTAAMNEINIKAMEERGQHMAALMETYRVNTANAAAYFEEAFAGAAEAFKLAISDAMATALVEGDNLKSLLDQVYKTIATRIISAIINMGLEFMAVHLLGQKMQAVAMAATVVMAKATALAWAPAAAMASLATAGTNAVSAQAGLISTTSMAKGLAGMAHDGIDNVPREGTWLLDKGERVFSADHNERITRAMESGGANGVSAEVAAYLPVIVNYLEKIASTQPIVFNGPGWDVNKIFDMIAGMINSGDKVLIRRSSRNGQELAA